MQKGQQNALIPSFALGEGGGRQYPLNMVLGGPKRWYGHFGEQKMFALAQKRTPDIHPTN